MMSLDLGPWNLDSLPNSTSTGGRRPCRRAGLDLDRSWSLALLVALTLTLAACDEPTSQAVSADKTKAQTTATPPQAGTAEAAKDETRRLELSESDFLENDTNRDPFRPYLKEFLTRPEQTAKIQRKVILQRYGLDELELIAVVVGRTSPRAMFRDPKGLGVTVKRGDYISKSAGRVKQILPDKVVVEIQQRLEDGQSVADRVIDLHPKDDSRSRYQ